MFTKVIIAMDLSDKAKAVFAKGLSIAQKYNAGLTLLHVLSTEEENSPLPVPVNLDEIYPATGNELTLEIWREQWDVFEQQGIDILKSRTEEATQLGLKAEYQQILGSPGRTICQIAKESNADLIVVGHRGRWGLSEILLGSVSNYVFHHATCCVLVVPTPD
ncbi:MAG: universal stress protein [Snowella sp.]|nr:universal stress protein [Snowella sp.]